MRTMRTKTKTKKTAAMEVPSQQVSFSKMGQPSCEDLPLQIAIRMDMGMDMNYDNDNDDHQYDEIIHLESCSDLDRKNRIHDQHLHRHLHHNHDDNNRRGENILQVLSGSDNDSNSDNDSDSGVDLCTLIPQQIILPPPFPQLSSPSPSLSRNVYSYHRIEYSLQPKEACCICGGGMYPIQQHRLLQNTQSFFIPLLGLMIGFIMTLVIHTICYIRRNRRHERMERERRAAENNDNGNVNANANDAFGDNIQLDEYENNPRSFTNSIEQIQSDRRELIMNNIIHKAVVAKNDEEGSEYDNESVMLPHEEIMMKRELVEASFHIPENDMLHDLSIRDDSINDNESTLTGALYDLSGKNFLRGQKSDLYLMAGATSMPSRDSTASLYSPSTCPICIDNYKKGDEIAWSYNENCRHAFHLECIVDWLMSHDECPMCRLDYLNIDESEEA